MRDAHMLQLLEMHNYGPYMDAAVEFSQNPDRPLTVIVGNAGTGKTSIMEAIAWCLYGRVMYDRHGGLPLTILHAHGDNPRGSCETRVCLTVLDTSGSRFKICRQTDASTTFPVRVAGGSGMSFTQDSSITEATIQKIDSDGSGIDDPTPFGTDAAESILPITLARYGMYGEGFESLLYDSGHVRDSIGAAVRFCNSDVDTGVLQDQVSEYFLRFVNEDHYTGVIMEDGRLGTIVGGRRRFTGLSAADQYALDLAFILSLRNAAGIRFPLVLDSPFNRLSRKVRLNIAGHIHEFLGGSQAVFLISDAEYVGRSLDEDPSVKESFEDKLGAEYCISRSDGLSAICPCASDDKRPGF